MPETINFMTEDGVTIVGDWYETSGDAKASILLLHMMPADRNSWATFAERLTTAGYNALAIDERGHGDSTHRGDTVLDYKTFSDSEQQEKSKDIDAALKEMAQYGPDREKIGVIGGSIGANLAIELGARDHHILAIGALSPGLDYHGIKTEPLVKNMDATQRLFLAVAADDKSTMVEEVKTLETVSRAQTTSNYYDAGGHATNLFVSHPELMDELIAWLDTIYA